MNKANNIRKQRCNEQIRDAYQKLILEKEDPSAVSVSDICQKAGINRSTFYAHYLDLSDLNESLRQWLLSRFADLFKDGAEKDGNFDFLKLFCCIKKDPGFFEVCFRLNVDLKSVFLPQGPSEAGASLFSDPVHAAYHAAFFEAGMMAITRKWLDSGCKESPEEMAQILKEEYDR